VQRGDRSAVAHRNNIYWAAMLVMQLACFAAAPQFLTFLTKSNNAFALPAHCWSCSWPLHFGKLERPQPQLGSGPACS
jgi:hypothetical protein